MSEPILIPLRATNHCRHYSYSNGPQCSEKCDQSDGVNKCMPNPASSCPSRADYTDEERAAWQQFTNESFVRMANAVDALPKPIRIRTSGKIDCPNCNGILHYSRWEGGASIQCETKNCVGPARFNIKPGNDWPV